MDGVAYLVTQTYKEDAIKQRIPVEGEPKEIFVTEESISRNEFFSAGGNGLRAELVLVTPAINYAGESEIIYNEIRYSIYRTYKKKNSDDIELYIGGKIGVQNGLSNS